MRLELASFSVRDVRCGEQTRYERGVLELDKADLLSFVRQDPRIARADLEVAFPGERTRIVNVRDVVEPRAKVSGPGGVFPGILGPVEPVGEGRTHRLSGVAVIASAAYRPTILSGTAAQDSSMVDMWGPGAEASPFGSTINIVLVLHLRETVTELEAHAAIQLAECRLAHRLAEATRDLAPESVEICELRPVGPSLPRVVHILSFLTNWHAPHSGVAYYGLPVRESLPTLAHPNEFLDGALTTDARKGRSSYTDTWSWMNNPVVLRLLREHGRRLNFLGVILQRTRFEAEHGKRVTAVAAAQMARLLGADGALITRTVSSGANFVDVMLTVQACERSGVQTVLLTPEWGGAAGDEPPLLFHVPEARAIVSTGSTDREIRVPAPARVIGVAEGGLVQLEVADPPFSPWGEATVSEAYVTGASDWWGRGHTTCVPS